jgi:hypothetical protein
MLDDLQAQIQALLTSQPPQRGPKLLRGTLTNLFG